MQWLCHRWRRTARMTGRAYSGVNVLLLWGSVIEFAYHSQGWLTFKQALEAGGNVRKGEKGVGVVYADRFTPQAEKERASASGEDARSIPFLKRFTVFNIAQCEGLRDGLFSDPEPLPEREIVPVAEEVKRLKAITYPGHKGLGHAWAYLPDAAETIALLLDRAEALEAFERFHVAGHWDADSTQMTRAIAAALGRDIPVKPLSWFLLRAAGWFQETPREIVKMRYLWQEPVRLANHRQAAFLGAEPHTPFDEAVRETLAGLGVS